MSNIELRTVQYTTGSVWHNQLSRSACLCVCCCQIFAKRESELQKYSEPLDCTCFKTSIWDETLYKVKRAGLKCLDFALILSLVLV